MEKVMQKFEKLMMSEKIDFLQYFTSRGEPKQPTTEVVELYEEVKNFLFVNKMRLAKWLELGHFLLLEKKCF